MAQQLQNVTLAAPGFGGINTQDSPLLQSQSFSAICDNAVIDKQGRIAARNGYTIVPTNASSVITSGDGVEMVSEFVQQDGTKIMFSAASNKLFTGTTTLTDVTPGGYTISANKWDTCSIANKFFLFQKGHFPLVYDASTSALTKIVDHGSAAGVPPSANICVAAYGRVWAADTTTDQKIIYWSDLLDGVDWSGGSSGSLDLTNVWPNGYDTIQSIQAHNNLLVIYGKNSILVYAGANSPSTMVLQDTIKNIGAVNRDCVVSTGVDLIYVDSTGVRSLGRTIQEKSAPIGDISRNVDNDIRRFILSDGANIRTVYDPQNAFIIVSFSGIGVVYVFDTRAPLQDGSLRTTTWSSIDPLSMTVNSDEELLIGVTGGWGKYTGQQDNGQDYELSYFTHPLDFGDSSRSKFLKKINLTTFQGSNARVVLQWGFDYVDDVTKSAFRLATINAGQYNISEFNTAAEYAKSPVLINTQRVNARGSGAVVTIGLTSTVAGQPLAIQQLNVYSLVGRIV